MSGAARFAPPPLRSLIAALTLSVAPALALTGCGNSSADLDPSVAVNIRVRNETGLHIDRLWLGAGPEAGSTFLTRYVNIDVGAVSDYQTVEPDVDNYRKVDFLSDGDRYIGHTLDPHVVLGVDSLSPGSFYTFVMTLSNGDVAVLSDVIVER